MSEIKAVSTFTLEICLAGDVGTIRQTCREHCYSVGLCVTVTPTTFVYTGGEESGAVVRLVNYPRFPSSPDELRIIAHSLAHRLMERTFQHTALLIDSERTVWISRRDECPIAR